MSSTRQTFRDDQAIKAPDWEIKREYRPGSFRVYAHGYFAPTWSVTILGRTIIGRKRIKRQWEATWTRGSPLPKNEADRLRRDWTRTR